MVNTMGPCPLFCYVYSPAVRERMRDQLKVTDKLVIGHVGRFHAAKNHGFLLDVFAQIRQFRQDAVLILLGEGPGMEAAKQKAAQLGIGSDVYFLGKKENVADYYQAMDALVFPSLYEGMPGTVLEAQAAGLLCLISDTITPEAGVTGLVEYKSLNESAKDWAEKILEQIKEQNGSRKSRLDALKKAGFDVSDQAVKMMDFYEKGVPLW